MGSAYEEAGLTRSRSRTHRTSVSLATPSPRSVYETVSSLQLAAGNRATAGWLARQHDPGAHSAGPHEGASVGRQPAGLSYYEQPIRDTLNIASTSFSPAGYVGLTLPVINGRTVVRPDPERGDDAEAEEARRRQSERDVAIAIGQIRSALNPPTLERRTMHGRDQFRVAHAGRNSGSAVVLAPTRGPWSARIDATRARRVLELDLRRRHADVLSRVLPLLPTQGDVEVVVREDRPDAVRPAVRNHEQQHARDWRRAFTSVMGHWQSGLEHLAAEGVWYDGLASLHRAIESNCGVDGQPGRDPVDKLANRLLSENSIAVAVLHATESHKPEAFDASYDARNQRLQVTMRQIRAADIDPASSSDRDAPP